MNTYEAILKRRSIRKFTKDVPTDEQIKKLLEAAMAAPSAQNKQPWVFYVIQNKEIVEKIHQAGRGYNYNSPVLILVCADDNLSYWHQSNEFYIQDCSAAIENILLEATELGLGTVWCGVNPVEERINLVKEILELPESIIPIGLIQLGYPDEIKEERTQYKEELVHYIK